MRSLYEAHYACPFALLKLTVGNVSHESLGLSIIPLVQLYTALTLKKCVAKWSETFSR